MNSLGKRISKVLRFAPSRRQVLEAAVAAGLTGFASSIMSAAPRREHPLDLAAFLPRLREMRNALQEKARPWVMDVEKGKLARNADKPEDRHTYTVDVGQLMGHFATVKDLEPYLALREFAAKQLIVDLKDDPYTKGFVLWRHNPGQKPDASGTTEALRIARALWTGAAAFDRPQDAELALTILDGYSRHQTVDKGIWMIANYFNFGSRSFATNSFIIDFDADFVREVADAHKGKDGKRFAELDALAENSYAVMEAARAPCGLLYDLLQPELKTMYFDMDVSYFSPNDIIQLNNACTTAATCAKGRPAVGLGTIGFLLPQAGSLKVYYYGRTGDRAANRFGVSRRAGAPEYASMARLAALLNHRLATATFVELGLPYWETVVSKPRADDTWMVSEVLLGLQAVLEMKE